MCITAIAWQIFADKPLVLLSNRDEFLQRPTVPLYQWQTSGLPLPIIAGQDSQAHGTWLGINPISGQWGIILNYRQIVKDKVAFTTSRGQILVDYLLGDLSPLAFARQLSLTHYDGFNLVIGNRYQAVLLNNRGHGIEPLSNGLHVLSNGQPNDDWFKTERLRTRVRQEILPLIAEHQAWQDAAFNILKDTQQAPVSRLPNTGLPQAAEQALSSIFIPSNRMQLLLGKPYGTRTSSLLTLTHSGFEIIEKNILLDTSTTFSQTFY